MRFRDKISGLLDEYNRASSAGKISILIQIRSLFQKATIQEGFEAIDAVRDGKKLNVLMGAGMKGVWYYYLAKRKGELMGL